MNDLLLTIQEEFHHRLKRLPVLIQRDVRFPVNVTDKILVAIGMRRVGKTYLLFQTIKTLLEQGVPLSKILYADFEDDRLLPASQEKLTKLIDSFYALYPENHDQLCYLFFDEIQNVDNWATVIRRLLNTKNVRIYLTGSSAKLLSKEVASSLRGRSLAIEVWPYNFHEYLRAQNNEQILSVRETQKIHDQRKHHLFNYMNQGGFPEIIHLPKADWTRVLQDYVHLVIFLDIIDRYQITNITLIKYMIQTLIKNAATPFSTHKFFNDLKSQGFSISKTTVYDYLTYIEDAYLAFTVPLYSESFRKIQTNPKKIYAIDTGLMKANVMRFSQNIGQLFENLIYLDLRRRGDEIYYYLTKDRLEVDFLTKDLEGKLHLYQVAWHTENTETYAREMRAIAQAEQELGIKAELITADTYLHKRL